MTPVVVYRPKETRLYVYSLEGRPLSVRGVRGELLMQVHGSDRVHRFPLRYAAAEAARGEVDYLLSPVDVSRIEDGRMTVTALLDELPHREEPQARFTQTFALSRPPTDIAVSSVTAADREEIARQRVCPVMGSELGSHGEPIKLTIGEQSLYICCRGCLARVEEDPQAYLAKALSPQGS